MSTSVYVQPTFEMYRPPSSRSRRKPLAAQQEEICLHHETQPESDLCAQIRALAARRAAYAKPARIIRQQFYAQCRLFMGFREAEKKEQRAIASRAKQAVDTFFSGKPSADLPEELKGPMVIFSDSLKLNERQARSIEKKMRQLVERLPVWAWGKTVRGLGSLSLANIIAETGDLSNYPNVAKVWQRMGLGDAKRPQRRAVAWMAGFGVITKKTEPYYTTYSHVRTAKLGAGTPATWTQEANGSFKAYCANYAKRVADKQLIADLWAAWNNKRRGGGQTGHEAQTSRSPAAATALVPA